MDTSMPSKDEITRAKILDAAKGLIMSKRFAGTSIDDVLK